MRSRVLDCGVLGAALLATLAGTTPAAARSPVKHHARHHKVALAPARPVFKLQLPPLVARGDYSARPSWLLPEGPAGRVDYDLPGVRANAILGLHPTTASTVPSEPRTGVHFDTPDVTVGAAVVRPF